jgi:hypothetical protein
MSREPDEVRMLQIEDNDLLSCNVAHFVRLFSKEKLAPSKAKRLWGSIVLTSGRCDKDSRPNWQIPEWRRYIARLFKELPHFSYFLLAVDQIYAGVVLSLLTEDELLIVDRNDPFFKAILGDKVAVSHGSVIPDRTAIVNTLSTLLEPVIVYCKEVFDEPKSVLNYLLQGFPEDVRDEVLEDLSFVMR